MSNRLEMCNQCCKYKSNLNENGLCRECEEEVKTVDCECYDCGNFEKVGIDLLGKRCIKCNGRLIPI